MKETAKTNAAENKAKKPVPTVPERLAKLREAMAEEGIDTWMIPTADYHNSEYVAPFFQSRVYFSGFTGSAGTLVVRQDEAGLWTDGRYFIQAEQELKGSGIDLYKMGEKGVPTIQAFLKDHMPVGSVLGFDGRCVTKKEGMDLAAALDKKAIAIRADLDLSEKAWEDRPMLPSHPVFLLDEEKYAGETTKSKLQRLRDTMKENDAELFISGKLDEIMWLYNIRGNDVECNPVALSYTIVTHKEAHLFIQGSEVTPELREFAKENGIYLQHYHAFSELLRHWKIEGTVMLDPEYTSYATYLDLCENLDRDMEGDASDCILEMQSPVTGMKAVKNETEIRNFKEIYVEDSAVLTKFIYWLKTHVGKEEITEGSAAAKLDGMRAEIKDFVELSFPTISAYGPNGAIVHYEPEGDGAAVGVDGMLMVDSGGHYLRGTTDVTRTMSLGGKITDEMIKDYTLTLVSQLQVMGLEFLQGANGMALDIMARAPMWKNGMDYKHGTGHGIGYLLNVHEGPQNLRYKARSAADEAPFEPGMVISDEPGVYKEGKHGIRIETILLTVFKEETADGRFLAFEPLTYVPLDRELIDVKYMTQETRELMNWYLKTTYEKISPFMNEEELAWLKEQCAEI